MPETKYLAPENFYPRSPCGERQMDANTVIQAISFLSTLSLRRATFVTIPTPWALRIFLSTLSLRRATVNEDRYGQQF